MVAAAAALVALCLAGGSGAQATASPRQVGGATAARPTPGTAATIAGGDATVVAWTQESALRQRIRASTGAPATIVELGPEGPGNDGAPTSAASRDGSVWVIASRASGNAQRLWAQQWTDGVWQQPLDGPSARAYDHHPAAAVDPDSNGIWIVWIGESTNGGDASMLYASRWTGRGWSAAEPLPRSLGAPMAPSIAVDATGTPFVAWAASDGTDAEIWVSTRRDGRWSAPFPASRNQVPDITPSVAASASGVLLTWISYTDAGYLPMARSGSGAEAWDSPVILDESPGGRPQAAFVDGRPTVLWRRLSPAASGGTITSRTLESGIWTSSQPLTDASGSPFSVAGTADGRVMLAFSRPDGQLGVVETRRRDPSAPGEALAALSVASAARFGAPSASTTAVDPAPISAAEGDPVPAIPENYTAFGDSITNGVTYNPDRSDSPGYRQPLQILLRAFFGTGTVFNAGVDGEITADGVGRIDNAIAAQDSDVILIMEGTNDIVNAIDVSVAAFNLRRMVQRTYEEKPDILPFLAQLPPRLDPGPDGFDGPGNSRIDELNAMIPTIGEEEGADVVDMNTPIDGHPELMSNPLHPSEAGYEVMAEQWYASVQAAVLSATNRGDIDASGRTDGLDLVQLALAFGSMLGETRYNPEADINVDGIVDGFDLDVLIQFFGQDVLPAGPGAGQ